MKEKNCFLFKCRRVWKQIDFDDLLPPQVLRLIFEAVFMIDGTQNYFSSRIKLTVTATLSDTLLFTTLGIIISKSLA